MASIQLESLSAFGRMALKLDADLIELARLSGQLQRIDLESDSGLEKAMKLLDEFAQHGKKLSEHMHDFSQSLRDANQGSAEAARLVGERAEQIRVRKEQQNQIHAELRQLEEKVSAANAGLTAFRKEGKSQLQVREELERVNVDLKRFLGEAQAIKERAAAASFKGIEKNAQALVDALRDSSKKVDKAIGA